MFSSTLPAQAALDADLDGPPRPLQLPYPPLWRQPIASDATRWGRDVGPPSTRNTSKGALIRESQAVFREVGRGATVAELRRACLEGSLLRKSATETRNRVWDALHWRYLAWGPPRWVLLDLSAAAGDDADPGHFSGLLYIHCARRDRLTFDFVTEYLWSRWRSRNGEVNRGDVFDFIAGYESEYPGVRKWRESTRTKLAGNLLSALRDFGLLRGTQQKALRRPTVLPAVALHLVRLLHREGLRGKALLDAADWRLFLWESADVTNSLSALAQLGELRFERSGSTVMLDVPMPIEDADR